MPLFSKLTPLAVTGVLLLAGCQASTVPDIADAKQSVLTLKSLWVKEHNNEVMLDPQTSGLASWRDGSLLTIADGSAHQSQILKLLRIDPERRTVRSPKLPISLASKVANSCFGPYLSHRPDLEALVVDPDDDRIFYSVTEDASRYPMSEECKAKFAGSGSTEFPTLLVKLRLDEPSQRVIMSDVRPLQYSEDMQIGNYPNDGIEGMTFGEGRTLYLALEKDANHQPRIFSINLVEAFWQSDAYYLVNDEKLNLPYFNDQQPHPINGLTYYQDGLQGWLVAAARNDNQLWLIDTQGVRSTVKISLRFLAETDSEGTCPAFEAMDNYSMEGLAVKGDNLWLINDPWKQNYKKNIQCAKTAANYEEMAPLLTWIPLATIATYLSL